MTAFPPAGPSVARRIETPRLVLAPMAGEHTHSMWRAIEASLPELAPWMAWARPDSFEGSKAHVEFSAKQWETARPVAWNFSILVEEEAVGTVGLERVDIPLRRAEMGYWLRSDLAGRGLMTEAASAVAEFAFDVVGFHRLELHAAIGNVGSARVAEKLGFRFEGVARDGGFAQDAWQDTRVFGLLSTDARPRYHLGTAN